MISTFQRVSPSTSPFRFSLNEIRFSVCARVCARAKSTYICRSKFAMLELLDYKVRGEDKYRERERLRKWICEMGDIDFRGGKQTVSLSSCLRGV